MLKERALQLHGAGVTVIPFYGVDTFEWRDYRNVSQSKADVEKMNWRDAMGLDIVSGSGYVNEVKVIKFSSDKPFTDKIGDGILKALGLRKDYPWVFAGKDGKSMALIVRFEHLTNVSYIRGKWKGFRIHISTEGRTYIPDYFNIPDSMPLFIEKDVRDKFIHSIENALGLNKDKDGYYIK